MPTTDDFRAELSAQIERARRQGRPHAEINAGELHHALGGYPPKSGTSHAMPSCCNTMWEEFRRGNAEIIHETASGRAVALTIRYKLPR